MTTTTKTPKNRLNGSANGSDLTPRATVTISPPNLQTATFKIIGTSPYVQHKFSAETKAGLMLQHKAGSSTKTKKKAKPPRDFQQDYENAKYRPANDDWPNGAIPAIAIKAAMVAACRLIDFKMTEMKQCVWVEADGYDPDEEVPLIRISKGKPRKFEQMVRNSTGVSDIRSRPMWDEGWEALVRIRFDADRFTIEDVSNLLMRAGLQVGIGEGRMASRMSTGCGWGSFRVDG